MSDKQYYTWEDVVAHDNENSMWIVADNKVYDVTKFWKRHPGGSYLVKSKAATDTTKHKKMHSTKAQSMWGKYLIGYVKDAKCC
jgi:cytochrome b involved in lipid metabolism